MHHVHYRTLFRNEPKFKNSLTHLEITHENRWKLQINFYTQIDSYIEQATHFRLERLKFVSLQQSNQSLSFIFLLRRYWFGKLEKFVGTKNWKIHWCFKLFRLEHEIPKIINLYTNASKIAVLPAKSHFPRFIGCVHNI